MSGNNGQPGDTIAEYQYDGLFRRIRKIDRTGQQDVTYEYYHNENWQVLEERIDGSPNPYAQYIWDVRYIDAPVVRFRDTDMDGDVDDTLYYTTDSNMNVTALVNEDGEVVERYPYGPVKVLNGAADADGAVAEWSADADALSCHAEGPSLMH